MRPRLSRPISRTVFDCTIWPSFCTKERSTFTVPVKGLAGMGVTKMSGFCARAEEPAAMTNNRAEREISLRIVPPATLVQQVILVDGEWQGRQEDRVIA